MRGNKFHSLVAGLVLLLTATIPAGCSGGGSAEPALMTATDASGFWAVDFSSDIPKIYKVDASKVGEGAHCYVYLEEGAAVPADGINTIIRQFDTAIYPVTTAMFGTEPNPGVDTDSKIYILLLDIQDGYNGTSKPSYIAGYFDPGNEYPVSSDPHSNGKEMLYMDIHPAGAGSTRFLITLAHEFQHMIHWEQKDHARNISDDTWLNEAMSEIAPVYCGYGPSYSRVLTFQKEPSDSLTEWNSTVKDYGVAYLWAQYLKDRFEGTEPNIFRSMLNNDQTGIDAVNEALGQINPSFTFAGIFSDWTIANYSGNAIAWPGHPEWSYRSIDMRAGTYGGITLPGLFPLSKQNPLSPLAPLHMWSADYYSYTAAGPDGTLTWTAANGADKAVLIDPAARTATELVSSTSYTLTTRSFLIVSNPAGSSAPTGAAVTRTSAESGEPGGSYAATVKNPKAMPEEADIDHEVQERARATGECEAVCVHPYFQHKERTLKAKGASPLF